MTDALDALRDLPGTAQTRGETDVIDVESHTMNLPAVREPAGLAVPDHVANYAHRVSQVMDIAAGANPWPGRFRWAHGLAEAIREGDPVTFRALIVAGLAHGFDGVTVSPGEFEVALLEFDVRRAGAR